ncbi:MAG: hypothetical protein K0S65_5563, partial [Labilithrix sp.]|nr:hypothetical protein [Labilithrix sp.]
NTIRQRLSALAILALAATAVQCSSSRAEFEGPRDAGPSGDLISPPEAGPDGDASTSPPEECTGENKQIYVITPSPPAIHRFNPETLTFALVGYLDCPATSAGLSANSMAIDRKGVAWVGFRGGSVAQLRLDTFECKEITIRNQPTDLTVFGMAFAKDDSITGETLYLYNRFLFKVDPATRELGVIGEPGLGTDGELTGTGDGQLYGFAPLSGVVAHFDKSTAKPLESYRTSALDLNEFAFAQWGGDFWLFTRPQGRATGIVTRFSPATGESKIVVADTGIRIIGAGSSTCAPYEPPK